MNVVEIKNVISSNLYDRTYAVNQFVTLAGIPDSDISSAKLVLKEMVADMTLIAKRVRFFETNEIFMYSYNHYKNYVRN